MSDLVKQIHEAVQGLDANGDGVVLLDHHAFDRVPCTRRTLYTIARKHAKAWGYEYRKAEYRPSGNPPFARVTADKQGKYHAPWLYALKHIGKG